MLSPNLLNTLTAIVAASKVEPFYQFANGKSPVIRALLKDELIIGNEQITDGADKHAFKATDKGIAEVSNGAAPPAAWSAPPPVAAPPAFAGTSPTPAAPVAEKVSKPRVPPVVSYTGARVTTLPEKVSGVRGRQKGQETYPFSKLQAPNADGLDFFDVAATAAMPNPYKTVKMTVFTANKRYNGAVKFDIRALNENGVDFARVYRVA